MLRKCDLEIANRMWSFDTFHQDAIHRRLKQGGDDCALSPDQDLLHVDFGSKHKKRTHSHMSLQENRNMTTYSTELHQHYSHILDVSTEDNAKLRMTRCYILADDTTQDSCQAKVNKDDVLGKVRADHPDNRTVIYLSDGGHQYYTFF